ncbi:MAG: class I adenylate-forming enzyme family protein [Bacteroidota bacterium]
MTLQARLRNTLLRSGAHAVEADGVWHTWDELDRVARSLATALDARGIPASTPLGWISRNRPDHLAVLFGLLAAGRSLVVISSVQSAERIALEVERLALPVIIADRADWNSDALVQACRRRSAIGLAVDGGIVVDGGTGEVGEAAAEQSLTVLTSGTTGPPKRIPLSMSALEAAAIDMELLEAEGDVPGQTRPPFIMFWPLANISGLYYTMPTGLGARPLVLMPKFSVEVWADAVERYRPRLLWLPPAAIRMVLDANVPKSRLASARALRYGASPLDAHVREVFEQRYGIPILSQYGATEFAGIVACWTLADHARWMHAKRGSIGRARPGMRLRVVDPQTGLELPPGSLGQLQVHAPRVGPDWQTTNDIAHIDGDGFVYLEGRADDAINRGGFKVVPEEVAAVLRQYPGVRDAAVVGIPDERLGRIPVAAIEAVAPDGLAIEDLQAFARARLLAYQVPARYVVAAKLPRTPTLKIDRQRVLRLFDT